MDAVDEGDKGGSLSRECKLPLEPFERGSVGDSALNASPADLVRRSSAIFLRRSSAGGGSGGWFVAILVAPLRRRFASSAAVVVVGRAGLACKFLSHRRGGGNFWRSCRVSGCCWSVLGSLSGLKAISALSIIS